MGAEACPATGTVTMAENQRNSTHESPVPKARGGNAREELTEVASILAAALLRLRTKQFGIPEKRKISRDNPLGCPGKTRPPAVNLEQKG